MPKVLIMKKVTVFYWIATGLVALGFLMSSVMYLSGNEEIVKGFQYMNLPGYLITFLGIAKAAGAIGILQNRSEVLKEWAYAGLSFNLLGAIYIHAVFGTSIMAPLLFLLLVFASYFLHKRKHGIQKNLQFSHQ